MSYIFYEIKEIKNHTNLSSGVKSEIVLHFLAKVSNTIILYETKQNIPNSRDTKTYENVVDSLRKIFSQVDPSLKLIKGKIREIFLSYSS